MVYEEIKYTYDQEYLYTCQKSADLLFAYATNRIEIEQLGQCLYCYLSFLYSNKVCIAAQARLNATLSKTLKTFFLIARRNIKFPNTL